MAFSKKQRWCFLINIKGRYHKLDAMVFDLPIKEQTVIVKPNKGNAGGLFSSRGCAKWLMRL
ncbi:MAG: hypothetical protein KIIPBIDF_01614 [Candidatus Methanoperedenaceae archaeon GB50]|nr:MAG: hypothetical protein KIIPBIDF_01614 [Candidatus Methanoperedenaceae archaeon GB50]